MLFNGEVWYNIGMENATNREFYVYRHLRKDENGKEWPYYVGKGHGDRAYKKRDRNRYWQNIAKQGYLVEIIMEDLTEEEAFVKEIEFIKMYRAMGYCEANLTDGGEGAKGCIRSKKVRKAISKRMMGNKIGAINRGRVLSKEWREKLSKAHKGQKPTPKQLENLRAMAEGRKGKPMSDITRKRLSEAKKGQKCSNEQIERLRKMAADRKGRAPWNKGRKMSPLSLEHKEKLKKSMALAWKENRVNRAPISEEGRKEISLRNKGRKHTEGAIKKIKEASLLMWKRRKENGE